MPTLGHKRVIVLLSWSRRIPTEPVQCGAPNPGSPSGDVSAVGMPTSGHPCRSSTPRATLHCMTQPRHSSSLANFPRVLTCPFAYCSAPNLRFRVGDNSTIGRLTTSHPRSSSTPRATSQLHDLTEGLLFIGEPSVVS